MTKNLLFILYKPTHNRNYDTFIFLEILKNTLSGEDFFSYLIALFVNRRWHPTTTLNYIKIYDMIKIVLHHIQFLRCKMWTCVTYSLSFCIMIYIRLENKTVKFRFYNVYKQIVQVFSVIFKFTKKLGNFCFLFSANLNGWLKKKKILTCFKIVVLLSLKIDRHFYKKPIKGENKTNIIYHH